MSLQAKDLRVGNWIYDRGGKQWQIDHWETMNKVSAKAHTTMCMGIMTETHPLTEYVDYLKPIPLTEQWLLDFGFAKDEGLKTEYFKFEFDELTGADLTIQREKGYEVFYMIHAGYIVQVLTVNKLQNLFFALTNQELELKTKP